MGEEAKGLSRRRVLIGGGLIGAAGLGGLALVDVWGNDPDADSPERSEPPVAPAEGIAAVGAAYLAGPGEAEADVAVLRTALPQLTATTPAALLEQFGALRPAVTADFSEGRVVEVDGWILARTEARAAALVHLTG